MLQTNFLDLVESNEDQIEVTAYQQENGRWVALICDGWWIGYGWTKSDAVKRVIKMYQDEINPS